MTPSRSLSSSSSVTICQPKSGELIELGAKTGVVEKSGFWLSNKSQRIGEGCENARQYLMDHPETERTIRAEAGVGRKGLNLLEEDLTPEE